MGYKILFAEDALRDFDEILEFIRKDSSAAAEKFGNSLLNHVELLTSFPRIGTPMKGRPAVRKLLHTPIGIYYRVHEDRKIVEVIRLLHGSRKGLG